LPEVLQPLVPLVIAVVLSAALTPVARAWAKKTGLLDLPSVRKAHQTPTPLMGGTAVFVAIAAAAVLCGLITGRTAAIAVGSVVVFLIGLLDDIKGMRPGTKLAGQSIAAAVAIALGPVVRVTGIWPVDVLLTLVWVVGLTNSLNLLDNMDGISSGVAAINALFIFFAATVFKDAQLGSIALCLSGAALGFLLYNFPPASIFLGDAGSMLYGFILAGLGVLLANHATHGSDILAPVILMGLPILDTTLVTVVRIAEGRRISQGGKDHISHRLALLGASPRGVAWIQYGLAAAFGVAAVAYLMVGPVGRLLLLVGFLGTAAVVGAVLGAVRIDPGSVARSS